MSPDPQLPVAIVGAGPIGLTTALGLAHYGVPFVLLEEDAMLSLDTKAGTTLTRTLEIWNRYGCVDEILAAALRIDEIGDIDRATNTPRASVQLAELVERHAVPVRHQSAAAAHGADPGRGAGADRAGRCCTEHRLESFEIETTASCCTSRHPDGVQADRGLAPAGV